MRPLAIDLCCGLCGWAHGLTAAGFQVIGFDLRFPRRFRPPEHTEIVRQDIRTLDGRQFRDARLIVASPPCQEFSRKGMPWHKDKPDPDLGIVLFETCRRIIREAGCPGIIENVRMAQKWMGPAEAHFSSFYLWGDVPVLRPRMKLVKGVLSRCVPLARAREWHLSQKPQTGRVVYSPAQRSIIPFDLAYWVGLSFMS